MKLILLDLLHFTLFNFSQILDDLISPSICSKIESMVKRPQLKFLKDQVVYVLDGSKTLEPRPRSHQWIERLSDAEELDLTYGPRFAPPKVFARAKIEKIEVRPFETTTKEDLEQISRGWEDKTPEEFAQVHNEWYAKELAKGYPVVWVFFKVLETFE